MHRNISKTKVEVLVEVSAEDRYAILRDTRAHSTALFAVIKGVAAVFLLARVIVFQPFARNTETIYPSNYSNSAFAVLQAKTACLFLSCHGSAVEYQARLEHFMSMSMSIYHCRSHYRWLFPVHRVLRIRYVTISDFRDARFTHTHTHTVSGLRKDGTFTNADSRIALRV